MEPDLKSAHSACGGLRVLRWAARAAVAVETAKVFVAREEREPGAFRAGVRLGAVGAGGVQARLEEGGSDPSGRSFSTK